jgi:copper chaperone NosL
MPLKLKLVALMITAVLVAACGAIAGGPPEIEIDRTACGHCGMLISEPLYAAAYQAPEADARVFDDIGCLRDAARAESGPLTYWFHDADGHAWVEGTDAVFVASSEFRTPMGGGLIAYGDRAAADRAAAKYRGRIIHSVTGLLAGEGGS